MDEKREALLFLRCEKIVNETISQVDDLIPSIVNVLKKDKLSKMDIELLRFSSRVLVCKRVLAQIESKRILDTDEKIDLGCMCSDSTLGSCHDCEEEICNLIDADLMMDFAME